MSLLDSGGESERAREISINPIHKLDGPLTRPSAGSVNNGSLSSLINNSHCVWVFYSILKTTKTLGRSVAASPADGAMWTCRDIKKKECKGKQDCGILGEGGVGDRGYGIESS